MGWAKDMLFLGGYLSPAVLAEEIELERAAQAADAPPATSARSGGSLAATAARRPDRASNLPARPCA